jgi:hypothetical protein
VWYVAPGCDDDARVNHRLRGKARDGGAADVFEAHRRVLHGRPHVCANALECARPFGIVRFHFHSFDMSFALSAITAG